MIFENSTEATAYEMLADAVNDIHVGQRAVLFAANAFIAAAVPTTTDPPREDNDDGWTEHQVIARTLRALAEQLDPEHVGNRQAADPN